MDRPEHLHVRASPNDLQLLTARVQLISTLSSEKPDNLKIYDAVNAAEFNSLLGRAENATSLPSKTVVAEFASGRLLAFDNVTRYLEMYGPYPASTPPPSPQCCRVAASPEECRLAYEESCKKITEYYIERVNLTIVSMNPAGLYNRVQDLPEAVQVPPELRAAVYRFLRSIYYKSCVVPVRDRDQLSKMSSSLAIFEESETDDARSILAQASAPAPMLLTLSRTQKRTRDREYVLHCLAVAVSVKFDDDSQGMRGGSSMYM